MLGASWSFTVTSWSQLVVLPLVSTAVQCTVVVPCGKVLGASLVTVSNPQLSLVATGTPRLTPLAVHRPGSVCTSVRLAGQVMLGASWSLTVTNWSQLVVLPEVSTAVQWTVVVPCGKVAGASLVTVKRPQLSLVALGTPRSTPVA